MKNIYWGCARSGLAEWTWGVEGPDVDPVYKDRWRTLTLALSYNNFFVNQGYLSATLVGAQ